MPNRRKKREYVMTNGKRLHVAHSSIRGNSAQDIMTHKYGLKSEDRRQWRRNKLIEGRHREIMAIIPQIIASQSYLDLDGEIKAKIADIKFNVKEGNKIKDADMNFLRQLLKICK